MHERISFPGGSDSKASAYNKGDLGSVPGLERSPGEGNGNPLQYSCLEIPWTEEPAVCGGHKRVGYNLVTKQRDLTTISLHFILSKL